MHQRPDLEHAKARCLTERSQTISTIAQYGDRRGSALLPARAARRMTDPVADQPRLHAAEHDLLSAVIADLGKEDLEGTDLVAANRTDRT